MGNLWNDESKMGLLMNDAENQGEVSELGMAKPTVNIDNGCHSD